MKIERIEFSEVKKRAENMMMALLVVVGGKTEVRVESGDTIGGAGITKMSLLRLYTQVLTKRAHA